MDNKKIELVVLRVGGKAKGVLTRKEYTEFKGKKWWDSTQTKFIPSEKWNSGEVNITNIMDYEG